MAGMVSFLAAWWYIYI